MNYRDLRAALTTSVAVYAVAVATPSVAQTRTFDLPAQPATTGIPELARQANIQILVREEAVRGRRTKAVKGKMSVDAAVQKLIAGTGLYVVTNTGRAYTLEADAKVLPTSGNNTSSDAEMEGDRIQVGIAEILVIGARTQNADIKRSENDSQPYVVFSRKDLESSQAVTVEEFLRTRLPQNAGFGGPSAQSTGNGKPYSSFNLRGLGSSQTLILVDGRRMANLANQALAPGQADINGIPVGSIERIEVLPASAGGIYGGNAVGGVINIILRRDYKGIELTANYNDTFDFHAPNGRLDINGGFALEGGRTRITFGGSISKSGTLRTRDRLSLIKNGIDLYYANVPPTAATGNPPLGNGVNVRSLFGTNLVLKPEFGGTNLGSTITTVPLGYGGVASDNGAALIANAGRFNLDIPDDLQGLQRGLLTSPEMRSFNVNVRRKFGNLFDLYVDYNQFQNSGTSYSANQLPNQVSLASAFPGNPFQQTVSVTFPTPGFAFPYSSKSTTRTLALGAIVKLPHSWALSLEYHRDWTKNQAEFYQSVVAGPVQCALVGIPPNSPSCPASIGGSPTETRPVLDIFRSPVDFTPYLISSPSFLAGPYRSTFTNPSLRASGPLFNLAGGPATLTVSIQKEASAYARSRNVIANTQNLAQPFYVYYNPRRQSTVSEYAEVVLPFVSAAQEIPLLRELELRAAVRHDDYKTEAPPATANEFFTTDPNAVLPSYTDVTRRFRSTNFTLSGKWAPARQLTLRASYATGFLPPNVVQVANTTTVAANGIFGVTDPLRGNQAVNYSIITTSGAGSESLRPETSRSLSFGAIITPVDGLRLSVDYSLIKKKGEIGGIPLTYLLANPSQFPGRVVRGNPLPGDPANFAGRIISIDQTPYNLLSSKFRAVDFQADYDLDTDKAGSFRFYALATWQPDSQKQIIVGSPQLNYAGNADGPLKWQGNGGIDWSMGGLGIRWNTQFYDSYNVFTTQDVSTAIGQSIVNTAVTGQGSTKIPAQSYSDLYVSYDFGANSSVLNRVRISAGIQNVFNKKPPVVAISSYNGAGYSTYGDPRLRRFTLTLRKAFGGD